MDKLEKKLREIANRVFLTSHDIFNVLQEAVTFGAQSERDIWQQKCQELERKCIAQVREAYDNGLKQGRTEEREECVREATVDWAQDAHWPYSRDDPRSKCGPRKQ